MNSKSQPSPGSTATFLSALPLRPQISHVVFDFDGTLSWIRHGWPALMFEVFRRHLPPTVQEEDVRTLLEGIVFGMNGRPTLVQMEHFARFVVERGGLSLEAEALRQEFQAQLDVQIAERLAQIRSGQSASDAYVIHGARQLLEAIRERELVSVILSSTIEHRVREESEALGLTHFFGDRIYGSPADPRDYTKLAVLQRVLQTDGITGDQLLSFGDGPFEIAATKELGGVAIAVCTDEEENGSGRIDPHKEKQLMEAGADFAIPDFRDAVALLNHLLAR